MVNYNKRQQSLLLTLSKCRNVKNLHKTINRDITKLLCDVCLNIICGNIPISKHKYKQLSKHTDVIEKLINKNLKLEHKQQYINQKGGFLQFILPLLASIVGTLIK